jgi:hypothetical protein
VSTASGTGNEEAASSCATSASVGMAASVVGVVGEDAAGTGADADADATASGVETGSGAVGGAASPFLEKSQMLRVASDGACARREGHGDERPTRWGRDVLSR